jgi:hypothetical protein
VAPPDGSPKMSVRRQSAGCTHAPLHHEELMMERVDKLPARGGRWQPHDRAANDKTHKKCCVVLSQASQARAQGCSRPPMQRCIVDGA